MALPEIKGRSRAPATPPDPSGAAEAWLPNRGRPGSGLARHDRESAGPEPSKTQSDPSAPTTPDPWVVAPRTQGPGVLTGLNTSAGLPSHLEPPGDRRRHPCLLPPAHLASRCSRDSDRGGPTVRPSRAAGPRGLGCRCHRASEHHRTKPSPASAPLS